MPKWAALFLTLPVAKRLVRGFLSTWLAQLVVFQTSARSWKAIALSALVGAIMAVAKSVRDAYPEWGDYLPV